MENNQENSNIKYFQPKNSPKLQNTNIKEEIVDEEEAEDVIENVDTAATEEL